MVHLELCWIFKLERFAKIREKLDLKCLAEFWISLSIFLIYFALIVSV